MDLACCTWSFLALDHERACQLVRLLGFDAVDIGVFAEHAHITPDEVSKNVTLWAERVSAEVRAHDLRVADVFLIPHADYRRLAPSNPSEDERREGREQFRAILDFAKRIGSPGMTIVPGVEFEGATHEQSLERAGIELSGRVDEAHAAGLQLSIEPHLGSIAEEPSDVADLLDRAPGLELTLDHSHFAARGVGPEGLDPTLDRVRHVHARGARTDRIQVGMRDNEIDFERLVSGLADVGFDADIAVEYIWIDVARANECDVVSETVLMRDRLRAAIAASRSAVAG